MSSLVVMAHFDVDRILRAHTLRTIENYAAVADRLVVVSASGLDEESLAKLPSKCEFLERPNFGYDFFSYKWGLDHVGDVGDYDHIVIGNDSFIGPTVGLDTILESQAMQDTDILGMTLSQRHAEHVQSFFFVVNQYVARSNVFRLFFKDMEPVTDRMKVISAYEIGVSKALASGGFKLDAYFKPTEEERALGERRWQWHRTHRLSHRDATRVVHEDDPNLPATNMNPAVAFADRVLLDDRLPLVKFDTLRYDPYALSADHLLAQCEAARTETFDGVRDFLSRTRDRYPFRPGEINTPVTLAELERNLIGYGMDEGFRMNDEEKNV